LLVIVFMTTLFFLDSSEESVGKLRLWQLAK
jgi:hypothetical protein